MDGIISIGGAAQERQSRWGKGTEAPRERRLLGVGVGREHVGILACREHRRYMVERQVWATVIQNLK